MKYYEESFGCESEKPHRKSDFYRLKGGECDIHGDFWNFQGRWISELTHPEVGTCIMCFKD